MPRMNLDEEEARLILKHREQRRFFRAGYQSAVRELTEFISTDKTFNEIKAKLTEMLSGL